jgi:enamine deaminase RidA (YjgF/YER057c/UK114 family)
MTHRIAQKLQDAGLLSTAPPMPLASYLPFVVSGDVVAISGVLPTRSGNLMATGRVGESVSPELAYECARQCAINLLTALSRAEDETGRRVSRVLRITGFVASAPGFTDQHKVLNGASDFIVSILGDDGRHSREAVGVLSLPLNAPVEVSAWAALAAASTGP